MKRYLVLLIFLSINFDKAIAMVPKNFAPRITYYAKNIYLFNNYIRQIKDSSGSAAQESFNKAQDLLNNIEKNLKVDLENNPVLRAYIDKKDFDIPTQRAILESIKPGHQKVSQETADKLGSELIKDTYKDFAESSDCNFNNIKNLIQKGANINKMAGFTKETILDTLIRYITNTLKKTPITIKHHLEPIPENCINVLKFLLNQTNINVNTNNDAFVAFLVLVDINSRIWIAKTGPPINLDTVRELLKLFFERGADLEKRDFRKGNFFDFAAKHKILQKAYDEHLAELKKKNLSALCGQLDKDLPFMSKDLSDLIAGYAVECEYKKKKEDKPA